MYAIVSEAYLWGLIDFNEWLVEWLIGCSSIELGTSVLEQYHQNIEILGQLSACTQHGSAEDQGAHHIWGILQISIQDGLIYDGVQ